jgi:hypothetical protein
VVGFDSCDYSVQNPQTLQNMGGGLNEKGDSICQSLPFRLDDFFGVSRDLYPRKSGMYEYGRRCTDMRATAPELFGYWLLEWRISSEMWLRKKIT